MCIRDRICLEPVAGKLLVEGWLSMTRLISLSRPESGAVRRQHLITENDIAILVQTKLKLGICNDDTLF